MAYTSAHTPLSEHGAARDPRIPPMILEFLNIRHEERIKNFAKINMKLWRIAAESNTQLP
jgi:hypothetical protein